MVRFFVSVIPVMCKYSSFRLCLYLRHSGNAFEPESRCFLKLCNYLWPTATNFVYRLHRPSPVIESEPPFIELSITANKLKRSVLCAFCVNGGEGTSDRHFDKTCFAFMALTRGNFCLAINLITKCHECSSVFYRSLFFVDYFLCLSCFALERLYLFEAGIKIHTQFLNLTC